MSNSLIRLLKVGQTISDSGDIESFNSFCVQFDAFIRRSSFNKTAHMEPKNDGTTPNPWRKNMDYASWESSPYYGNVADFMKRFPGGIREWIEWRHKSEKERFQLWDPEKTKTRKARLEALMKIAEAEEFQENKGNPYRSQGRDLELEDTGETGVCDFCDEKDLRDNLKSWSVDGRNLLLHPECIDKFYKKNFGHCPTHINKQVEAHFEPVGPDDTERFPKEEHIYSGPENVGAFKSIKEYIENRRKETGQSADDAAMDAAKDFVNYYKLLLKGKNRRKKETK